MKAFRRPFTFEAYCWDGIPIWRLHEGDFESNRDSLSPQMYWARDFYANSLAAARRKARSLVRFYKQAGVALSSRTPCSMFNFGTEVKPAHGIAIKV